MDDDATFEIREGKKVYFLKWPVIFKIEYFFCLHKHVISFLFFGVSKLFELLGQGSEVAYSYFTCNINKTENAE